MIKRLQRVTCNRHKFLSFSYRNASTFSGVPFTHNTEEAKQIFMQWARKSKFSPIAFHTHVGKIDKYYVPFYLFDLEFTVQFQGRMTMTGGRDGVREVRSPVLQLSDSMNNMICYASTVFEKDLVEKSAYNGVMQRPSRQQLSYSSSDYKVDIYTIDSNSAFNLIRYLKVDSRVQQMCQEALRQSFPGYSRYEINYLEISFGSVRSELIYYPLFVMSYPFMNAIFSWDEELRSFADGRSLNVDSVQGYRHYGFLRTFGTSLIASCASIPLIADTDLYSYTDYYPYCVLLSGCIGLLAVYSPVLMRLWHNFNRQRILSFISMSQRSSQEQEYYRQQQQAWEREYAGGQQQYHRKYQERARQRPSQEAGGIEKEIREAKDYYTLLGLDPKKRNSYTDAQIKKAYRTAAMKYHPDMHPGSDKKQMEEKFKVVNEAYMTLQDESSRRQYNLYGR